MPFENTLALGNGIFTVAEISRILGLPYATINRWLKVYWDGKLGAAYQSRYSWTIDNSRAVGFHTLVEFYVMMQFAEAGVKPAQVLKAHKELASFYKTNFPFAQKQVIESISTDGKTVFLNCEGSYLELNGSKQFNLGLIQLFFKKLEFDNELLASRFWPMGKDKAVVCDPHHKFGQPVIEGTNIQTEAIYKMYLAKEPIPFIASIYELPVEKVKDAISYHKTAA